ncbi:MAG: hypothetical protein HYY01_00960 [Chloroflexi bacterium]|nr:hypothetical protein [Chloroflexota bacterium]
MTAVDAEGLANVAWRLEADRGVEGEVPQEAGQHIGDHVQVRVQDMDWPALLCSPRAGGITLNSPAATLLGAEAPGAAPGEGRCPWQDRCTPGKGWTMERRVKGREGAPLELRLVAIPVQVSASGISACLILIENQTEARIHARELEIYARELSQIYQTNQEHLHQLEASQKAREHFFSLVSHELKTPLTSLMAAQELLNGLELSGPDAENFRKLLQTMNRSTSRLRRLISDLLDLAQAQSGALSLDIGVVDMVEVVAAVLDEMGPFFAEKRLSVAWRPRFKDGLYVKGDEIRLQQVVQNLMSNAIKAAAVGGSIRVSLGSQDRRALVTVANPGVALDPAIRDKLFEPFRKSSAGNFKAGAGLGLTVVHTLVEAHGGSVAVHAGRRNTAFTIAIPLANEERRQ